MVRVGKVAPAAQRLMDITHEAMWIGIRRIRPGTQVWAISGPRFRPSSKASTCQSCENIADTASAAFSTKIRKCCIMAKRARASSCVPGMTFTVEPMVNAGKRHVRLLPDGWTVITKDHSLSAQWEHTVLVTDTGLRSAHARRRRALIASIACASSRPKISKTSPNAAIDPTWEYLVTLQHSLATQTP